VIDFSKFTGIVIAGLYGEDFRVK